eukprot:4286379-Amphidinium_carterae.1
MGSGSALAGSAPQRALRENMANLLAVSVALAQCTVYRFASLTCMHPQIPARCSTSHCPVPA